MSMIKRFVFVKPFYNQNGDSIPVGTQVDIIDDKIFMSYETGGSQVAPSMYESLKKFIEDEYNFEQKNRRPNYLHEVAVPYNKA